MDEEEKGSAEEKSTNENTFKKLINIAVVGMLVLLIFFALFTFFFSMQDAISRLFTSQYAPLMQAIFSLVIIGVGVYLVKMFLSK